MQASTMTSIPPLHRWHRSSQRRPTIIRAAFPTESEPSPPQCDTTIEPRRKLNKYSSQITELKSQGDSQAVLYSVGLSDEDMKKPHIRISSMWYEGNTCNMHLLRLSKVVKKGVTESGMVGFQFNTVGISDAKSWTSASVLHNGIVDLIVEFCD